MKYRKAIIQDAEGIANVLIQSYNIDSIEEGIKVFKEGLNKGYNYIVAIDNKKIIGLTSWQMHGQPKHQLTELVEIAVLPEFRGKGIAKLLFENLIKKAQEFYKQQGSKLRKLYLLTHESNKRAQAFYEKMGFKHEATLKKHYYDKEDERVYSMFFD